MLIMTVLLSVAVQAQETTGSCNFMLCVDVTRPPVSSAMLRSDWQTLPYSLIAGLAVNGSFADAGGIKNEQTAPLAASNSLFSDIFALLRDKVGRWLINSLNQFAPLWLILTGLTGLLVMRRRLRR